MAYDIQALRQKYGVGTPATPASQTPVQAPGAPSTIPAPDIQALRQKYNVVPPTATADDRPQGSALGTAAKITDAVFGSGKVGDLIGATSVQNDLAKNPQDFMPAEQTANLKDVYASLSPEAKARLEAKGLPTTLEGNAQDSAQIASKNVPLPSGKELLGSLGQSALYAIPEGRLVEGLGRGFLAKTLAGAGTGYAYDVANNLQDNKTGIDMFKPGAGTVLGAATPAALLGGKAVLGATKAAPAVAGSLTEGLGNVLGAPFRFLGEKAEKAVATSKLPEVERALVKSGFDDRSINFLKTTSPQTRDSFGKMVDIAEKNAGDIRARVQPKQVVGKEFLNRIDTIVNDSKKAASEITSEAKKIGKVDVRDVLGDFADTLEQRGVLARKDGTLISTGRVPRADLKYYESITKEIQDVTKGRAEISRAEAHALRQRLYATLEAETRTGGKIGERPFSDLVDQDVNSLRRNLAKKLGPKYEKAAQRFAENERTLRGVAKFAGVPNKAELISSKDLKLGEGLMRALGNAADKPVSLMQEVNTLAQKRGGKFEDNLMDLIDFADNLEELYGIRQTRSFEGGVQRGVGQSGIPNIPTGKLDLLMKAAQSATKTSNQDKINALKKFLGK